jgi:lipoprotein NlpI
MPQLWQRGIALYYAGRYDDCRKQFEAHRTVNPDDVENAAWHYLCVARAESPARAKAALLPVGPDARVPMKQVYELFKGAMTPEQVMTAGGTSLSGQVLRQPVSGPLLRSHGRRHCARGSEIAASERFRSSGGYMHMVARVHVARLAAPPLTP